MVVGRMSGTTPQFGITMGQQLTDSTGAHDAFVRWLGGGGYSRYPQPAGSRRYLLPFGNTDGVGYG